MSEPGFTSTWLNCQECGKTWFIPRDRTAPTTTPYAWQTRHLTIVYCAQHTEKNHGPCNQSSN